MMKLCKTQSLMTYTSTMMFSSRFGHQFSHELEFRTDTPTYSRKSQKGLYHGKTHGGKYKICFSDKRHRFSQKPNVSDKLFYSHILDKNITLPATAHAIKCIVKAGSFDNYILNTHPAKMNSKMGMFLRRTMQQKLANPDMEVPYIPFSYIYRDKREYKRRSYLKETGRTVHIPAHIKRSGALTTYYIKQHDELTREELDEIQIQMKNKDYFKSMSEDERRAHPYFKEVREELLAQQPMRHDIIRQYWEKNKDNKKFRETILKMAEDSEAFPRYVLQEDYIYFRDAIPEINQFLAEEVEKERTILTHEQKLSIGDVQLKIGAKNIGFNPFDSKQPKKEKVKEIRKQFHA